MQLAIRSHGFPLTESLRAHVERRIRSALSHAEVRIRSVTVVLSDINGPRGGRDKACRVRVAIKDRQVLVIDDTEENMYAAIDRAADRAGSNVGRALGRALDRAKGRLLRRPKKARTESGGTGGDDEAAARPDSPSLT